jgi:hypothetical protein
MTIGTRVSTKRIVSAEDIVYTLEQKTDSGKYKWRGGQISGKLDLRNHTVDVPVVIQGCEILHEVDLRRLMHYSNDLDLRTTRDRTAERQVQICVPK